MPTKRTYRGRGRRVGLTEIERALLRDAPLPVVDCAELFFARCEFERTGPALWTEHGKAVLRGWVASRPGTRPSYWWLWDAPRWPAGRFPGFWFDGQLPEPRLRLGGIGTPSYDVFAYVPRLEFGLPVDWFTESDLEIYGRGKVLDMRGRPVGGFRGVPIDPSDPPIFESQTAYLRRRGLLLRGERGRLRVTDFEPERIACAGPDDDDPPMAV